MKARNVFFEILDSCHLIIIIIFCILMTFQNEMWLVKPEELYKGAEWRLIGFRERITFSSLHSDVSPLVLHPGNSHVAPISPGLGLGNIHPAISCSSLVSLILQETWAEIWGFVTTVGSPSFRWKILKSLALKLKRKGNPLDKHIFHKHLSNTHPSCKSRVPNSN